MCSETMDCGYLRCPSRTPIQTRDYTGQNPSSLGSKGGARRRASNKGGKRAPSARAPAGPAPASRSEKTVPPNRGAQFLIFGCGCRIERHKVTAEITAVVCNPCAAECEQIGATGEQLVESMTQQLDQFLSARAAEKRERRRAAGRARRDKYKAARKQQKADNVGTYIPGVQKGTINNRLLLQAKRNCGFRRNVGGFPYKLINACRLATPYLRPSRVSGSRRYVAASKATPPGLIWDDAAVAAAIEHSRAQHNLRPAAAGAGVTSPATKNQLRFERRMLMSSFGTKINRDSPMAIKKENVPFRHGPFKYVPPGKYWNVVPKKEAPRDDESSRAIMEAVATVNQQLYVANMPWRTRQVKLEEYLMILVEEMISLMGNKDNDIKIDPFGYIYIVECEYVWSLSNKASNKLQHALNGNISAQTIAKLGETTYKLVCSGQKGAINKMVHKMLLEQLELSTEDIQSICEIAPVVAELFGIPLPVVTVTVDSSLQATGIIGDVIQPMATTVTSEIPTDIFKIAPVPTLMPAIQVSSTWTDTIIIIILVSIICWLIVVNIHLKYRKYIPDTSIEVKEGEKVINKQNIKDSNTISPVNHTVEIRKRTPSPNPSLISDGVYPPSPSPRVPEQVPVTFTEQGRAIVHCGNVDVIFPERSDATAFTPPYADDTIEIKSWIRGIGDIQIADPYASTYIAQDTRKDCEGKGKEPCIMYENEIKDEDESRQPLINQWRERAAQHSRARCFASFLRAVGVHHPSSALVSVTEMTADQKAVLEVSRNREIGIYIDRDEPWKSHITATPLAESQRQFKLDIITIGYLIDNLSHVPFFAEGDDTVSVPATTTLGIDVSNVAKSEIAPAAVESATLPKDFSTFALNASTRSSHLDIHYSETSGLVRISEIMAKGENGATVMTNVMSLAKDRYTGSEMVVSTSKARETLLNKVDTSKSFKDVFGATTAQNDPDAANASNALAHLVCGRQDGPSDGYVSILTRLMVGLFRQTHARDNNVFLAARNRVMNHQQYDEAHDAVPIVLNNSTIHGVRFDAHHGNENIIEEHQMCILSLRERPLGFTDADIRQALVALETISRPNLGLDANTGAGRVNQGWYIISTFGPLPDLVIVPISVSNFTGPALPPLMQAAGQAVVAIPQNMLVNYIHQGGVDVRTLPSAYLNALRLLASCGVPYESYKKAEDQVTAILCKSYHPLVYELPCSPFFRMTGGSLGNAAAARPTLYRILIRRLAYMYTRRFGRYNPADANDVINTIAGHIQLLPTHSIYGMVSDSDVRQSNIQGVEAVLPNNNNRAEINDRINGMLTSVFGGIAGVPNRAAADFGTARQTSDFIEALATGANGSVVGAACWPKENEAIDSAAPDPQVSAAQVDMSWMSYFANTNLNVDISSGTPAEQDQRIITSEIYEYVSQMDITAQQGLIEWLADDQDTLDDEEEIFRERWHIVNHQNLFSIANRVGSDNARLGGEIDPDLSVLPLRCTSVTTSYLPLGLDRLYSLVIEVARSSASQAVTVSDVENTTDTMAKLLHSYKHAQAHTLLWQYIILRCRTLAAIADEVMWTMMLTPQLIAQSAGVTLSSNAELTTHLQRTPLAIAQYGTIYDVGKTFTTAVIKMADESGFNIHNPYIITEGRTGGARVSFRSDSVPVEYAEVVMASLNLNLLAAIRPNGKTVGLERKTTWLRKVNEEAIFLPAGLKVDNKSSLVALRSALNLVGLTLPVLVVVQVDNELHGRTRQQYPIAIRLSTAPSHATKTCVNHGDMTIDPIIYLAPLTALSADINMMPATGSHLAGSQWVTIESTGLRCNVQSAHWGPIAPTAVHDDSVPRLLVDAPSDAFDISRADMYRHWTKKNEGTTLNATIQRTVMVPPRARDGDWTTATTNMRAWNYRNRPTSKITVDGAEARLYGVNLRSGRSAAIPEVDAVIQRDVTDTDYNVLSKVMINIYLRAKAIGGPIGTLGTRGSMMNSYAAVATTSSVAQW